MSINVFIVDDSATARAGLKAILHDHKNINIIGFASNPIIALKKMQLKSWPDVIISDLVMPEMDGVAFLDHLNQHRPTPFIIFSNYTGDNAQHSVDALLQGAIDVIAKPNFQDPVALDKTMSQLNDAIVNATTHAQSKALVQAFKDRKSQRHSINTRRIKPLKTCQVIAIGSSTGGTTLIEKILSQAGKESPPFLIVQHMPAYFTATFAKRVDQHCDIVVKEAEDQELLKSGTAYIAKGGLNMQIQRTVYGDKIQLTGASAEDKHSPSVDKLMQSVATIYKQQALGIILTGMGKDGARGLLDMKRQGATTIAQTKEDCAVYGMPKAAMENGAAQYQYRIDHIIELTSSLTNSPLKTE